MVETYASMAWVSASIPVWVEHKEENEGKNSRGRLSAEEFNNLIDREKNVGE